MLLSQPEFALAQNQPDWLKNVSGSFNFTLLGFLVRMVLTAVGAELLHFKTFGGRLFVLGGRVVPVLAFTALERDDFSWHSLPSY